MLRNIVFAALLCAAPLSAAEPVFSNSDFEQGDLTNWTAQGQAFQSQPTCGDNVAARKRDKALHAGNFWIGTFEKCPRGETSRAGTIQGDGPTGILTSIPFEITRKYITFRIGGGRDAEHLYVAFFVEGKEIARFTGNNAEGMREQCVDLRPYRGKTAQIKIVDESNGEWGHINVDDFQWCDDDMRCLPRQAVSFRIKADKPYLLIPVHSPRTLVPSIEQDIVNLRAEGGLSQSFSMVLPNERRSFSWWTAYPAERFAGKIVEISAENLTPEGARWLRQIRPSDTPILPEDLFEEPYRNQWHYTPPLGWNNDVNGAHYRDGLWHVFYQYNPLGAYWGNMHWRHIVSKDLIHWEDKGIQIFQNTIADMAFSGSGFVDEGNTSGLDPSGRGASVVAYTSSGRGECLAYSLDGGRTWKDYAENPVLKHPGRDPKIFWYAPEQKWGMIVFDEHPKPLDPAPKPPFRWHQLKLPAEIMRGYNFAIYSSKNLKEWTLESRFVPEDRTTIFECPELFEVKIEGEPGQSVWVAYNVRQFYYLGQFDGKTFTPQSGPFTLVDQDYRAAQLFSNAPDNRRIQIGWLWQSPNAYAAKFPDIRFTQGLTVPVELTAHRTPDGLRLFAYPVRELEQLREEPVVDLKNPTLEQAQRALSELAAQKNPCWDIIVQYACPDNSKLSLSCANASIDTRSSTLSVTETALFTPSPQGEIRMLTDVSSVEMFLDKGRRARAISKDPSLIGNTPVELKAEGPVKILRLTVYPLKRAVIKR